MGFDHLDKMTNDELHDYMHNEEKTTEQWLELIDYSARQWNEEKEEWKGKYEKEKKELEEMLKKVEKLKKSLQRSESALLRKNTAIKRLTDLPT